MRRAFVVCCFAFIAACEAGLFYDVRSFIGSTISKRRGQAKFTASLEPAQPSPEEIIEDLKSENALLYDQVGALKSVVVFQKKQLIESKKEKEALRKLLNSQVDDLTKRIEMDTEKIKRDLSAAFQEEKDAMIATFEEEKEVIKEEHAREVEDLRDELMKRVEEKSSEVKSLKKMTTSQAKEIVDFQRRQTEALKDIAELKKTLKQRADAQKAAEAAKEKSLPDEAEASAILASKQRPVRAADVPPQGRSSKAAKSVSSSANKGTTSSGGSGSSGTSSSSSSSRPVRNSSGSKNSQR